MRAKVTRRAVLIGATGYIATRIARSGAEKYAGSPVVLQPQGEFVWTLAVSRSGRFAASGHVDLSSWGARRGAVIVWDLEARRALGRHETFGMSTVAFSPDESLLLVGGRTDRAKILRRNGGGVVRELPLVDGSWAFAGAFSEDGDRLVLCESTLETPDQDGQPSTKTWGLKSGKASRAFPRSAIGFTQDASLAMGWDGALWNLITGRDESAWRPPRDTDWSPRALAPDGRLALLSSMSDNAGPVGLWDPTRDSKVRRLSGHTAQVAAAAFNGNGKRVVTGAGEKRNGWQDCTVRVWDTSTARELVTLRGHEVGVSAVATSPDGRRIVSGDGGGRVLLWERSP